MTTIAGWGLTEAGTCGSYVLSLVLLMTACEPKQASDYWTPNGKTVENITWDVPAADSSVLCNLGGRWQLPIPPENHVERTITRHVRPSGGNLPNVFMNADQLVRHEAGMLQEEYYRVGKQGLFLLGFSGHDATASLMRCNPPLLLLPSNPEVIDAAVTAESMMQVWDAEADSFRNDGLCRATFKVIERGTLSLPSGDMPAILVKMTLSKDLTLKFGNNDLIMTDAVTVKSNVLLTRSWGSVLEWGSRLNNPRSLAEEVPLLTERVIRITLHRPLKADWGH